MQTNTIYNFWLICGLILASVIFRLSSNTFSFFNFTPLIAVALFSGAKFKDTKWAVCIPVLIFFISDIILAYVNNFEVFHNDIFFTYAAVLLIVMLGRLMHNRQNHYGQIFGFSLLSSLLFFLITNFGVWLFGNMYTLDVNGLITCFTLAIPFNKWSFLADLFFVFTLFGTYEWLASKIYKSELALQKHSTKD